MKECSVCHEILPIESFCYHAETADKLYTFCRKCKAAKQRSYRERTGDLSTLHYEKTKKGFLMRMYRNMQSRVKGIQKVKKHLYQGLELISREEFYDWAMNNPKFHELFDVYEALRYDQMFAPSIDRIDPLKGYVLGNMQFLTHERNSLKACFYRYDKQKV